MAEHHANGDDARAEPDVRETESATARSTAAGDPRGAHLGAVPGDEGLTQNVVPHVPGTSIPSSEQRHT